MCRMCEEEAFHRAYLEYMTRKAAEAAAGNDDGKAPPQAEKFEAEDLGAAQTPAAKT